MTSVVNAYSLTISQTSINPGITQFLLTVNVNPWLQQSHELSTPLPVGEISFAAL